MVNWHDPVNVELQFFGVLKLEHLILGVFTWEIFSTLHFDWQILTGKRTYKWPYLLYVGVRFFGFSYYFAATVAANITTQINCQVSLVILFILGYLAIAFSSALLALRTVAFWDNQKAIMTVAFATWLVHVGFLIFGVTQARSSWDPATSACTDSNTEKNLKNILVTTCTDIAFLIIMLAGIWRRRKAGPLWKLVYRQGIIWMAVATFGEIPAVILVGLNFNDAMNLLLQPVAVLSMTLCSTRMYRELCEYARPVHSTYDVEATIDISPMKVPALRNTGRTSLSTTDIGE